MYKKYHNELWLIHDGNAWVFEHGNWIPRGWTFAVLEAPTIGEEEAGMIIKTQTEQMIKLYESARTLAETAHAGQKDKAGKDYFSAHVLPVARMASSCNNYAEIVGLLHDVLEDTDVTEQDLRKQFPDEIVDAVVTLTHRKGEPYMDYVARVKENKLAKEVKKCDLASNMDSSRLPELTEEDEKRMLKYAKAYGLLMR